MSTDQVQLLGGKQKLTRIEVAPGVRIGQRIADHAPKYGFVRLRRNADGTLTPMLSTWGCHIPLTMDLGERLGIHVDYRTFKALIGGGFIRAKKLSPRRTLIEVESLHHHLLECEDPEFWTEERIARYQAAEAEGK